MRNRFLYTLILLMSITTTAQINPNSLLGLPTVATTAELINITGASVGTIVFNIQEKKIYMFDGTNWVPTNNDNWVTNGNIGLPNGSFLGTTDDFAMKIRSNNIEVLEFGRRQTLGLTQNYPDYTNNDQYLTHIKGDNGIAALQFMADGASFYKPMFFTTSNGSFRLKGSAGRTDLFEIGSGGPNNQGSMEFIIGDDGNEAIIFKRYDYRNGQFHKELFRVQGSNGSAAAKTRFGININTAEIALDPNYNTNQNGNAGNYRVANSTLEVQGSISKSILTTTANLTLTEDHHTIVLGGNHNIVLPPANSCQGRIYIIKNSNNSTNTISSFINKIGAASTSIALQSILWIQSDGINWQQINN